MVVYYGRQPLACQELQGRRVSLVRQGYLDKLKECPKQDDGSVNESATARQRVDAPRIWGCYVRNLRGDAVKGVDWRREVPGAYVLQPKRRYKYV